MTIRNRNYLEPAVWARLLSAPVQALLGQTTRCLAACVGAAVWMVLFLLAEWRQARRASAVLLACGAAPTGGDRRSGSGRHRGMPVWAYLVSVYLSFALLKIRTFPEHRCA